jgi:hypothetical protein
MAANKLTPEEKLEIKRARDRAYAAAHREAARQRAADWYKNNTERAQDSHRLYDATHKEQIKERRRKYSAEHSAENVARAKAWVAANPERAAANALVAYKNRDLEKARVTNLAWRIRHKERRSALARSQYAADPIPHLVREAARRAKVKGMEFDGLKHLLGTKPANCLCCALPLDYSEKEKGRVNRSPSLDRLRQDSGYTFANVRVICWRCNRLKSDAVVSELEAIVAYMRREGQT